MFSLTPEVMNKRVLKIKVLQGKNIRLCQGRVGGDLSRVLFISLRVVLLFIIVYYLKVVLDN